MAILTCMRVMCALRLVVITWPCKVAPCNMCDGACDRENYDVWNHLAGEGFHNCARTHDTPFRQLFQSLVRQARFRYQTINRTLHNITPISQPSDGIWATPFKSCTSISVASSFNATSSSFVHSAFLPSKYDDWGWFLSLSVDKHDVPNERAKNVTLRSSLTMLIGICASSDARKASTDDVLELEVMKTRVIFGGCF